MRGFDPRTSFGPDVAASYDDEPRGDEEAASTFLAEMVGRTGSGRALELAVGTGRIAVPLTELGVEVDGVELSAAMVDVLEGKGCDLDVWVGDMATVDTGRTYGLVYLVFNTIFNLLTQDEQVACFANAARHLDDDGVFVVEAAVPSAWLPSESYARG